VGPEYAKMHLLNECHPLAEGGDDIRFNLDGAPRRLPA